MFCIWCLVVASHNIQPVTCMLSKNQETDNTVRPLKNAHLCSSSRAILQDSSHAARKGEGMEAPSQCENFNHYNTLTYFEDQNLRLTQKLGQKGRFAKVSLENNIYNDS